MLRSGSADPRESGVGLRYNNPKAEGVRAGDNWLPLLGGTATGASARGEHSNDFSYGVIGGLPLHRGEGEVSSGLPLAEGPGLGKAPRRAERKGQRKRFPRQRKSKGRQSRASEGREGEREEMMQKQRRELDGSEIYEDVSTAGKSAGYSSRPACFPAPWPDPSFGDASGGTTGPEEASSFFRAEGKTFGDMAKTLFCMFENLEISTKVPRSRIKFSGGIFPLPECPRALREVLGQVEVEHLAMLRCVCKALNSYSGSMAADGLLVSAAAMTALKSLASTIRDVGLAKEKFEGVTWEDFGKVKTVDYRGEEVQVARRFCWENIEPALPDGIGSIPLVDVCEGGTLDYVVNYGKYLLPVESQVYTKSPKVFVDEDAWEQACSGLLRKGGCRIIPKSEVYHLHQGPVLNGLFGVSKQEFVEGG